MRISKYFFDDFAVGDYVVFERSYGKEDFAAFAKLSGDRNPLHHDTGFSTTSGFRSPIVPMHLSLAPLSMVAGMVFPGEPSLYLGHEVRAIGPVFYDEPIQYSARIETVNASHRVLGIRVLGLRSAEVVLDATMRVQARTAEWTTPPALAVRKATEPAAALVTGASGEIGGAIADALAKRGWRLLLQDRGESEKRERLKDSLRRHQFEADFVTADLSNAKGQAALLKTIKERDDLALIVHAASPRVDAPLQDLVAVNFSALRTIVDAVLPQMLARQNGAAVLIGSSATELSLRGWEAYAGAKSMAANLIDRLERSYSGYGIRGITLMPGLVATEFSKEFRGDIPALLPQEVADAVVRALLDRRHEGNVVMLEPRREVRGRLGFHSTGGAPDTSNSVLQPVTGGGGGRAQFPEAELPIAQIVRSVLGLAPQISLKEAALGVTPGWDSLKHIELLLQLESALGIRFAAGEMEAVHHFSALEALCAQKLSERLRA